MDTPTQSFPPKRSWASEHPLLILGAFLIVCLGPFVNKAVHIDDPLFAWSAEWIQKHPLDFYGFDVNWYGLEMPMYVTNQNPPATAYFLAFVSSLFGWREIVLHVAFLLVAFASAAGIYRLARMWCERPLPAAIVAIVTPVFLVSSTTLMCDVLMLALWVWTVVIWESALKDGGVSRLLAAGGLAGLAVLTKYSALTLLPVLFVLGALRKRRPGWWLAAFLLPVAVLAAYQFATAKLYGQALFSITADYAATQRAIFEGGWDTKLITGLAFAGACLLPLLFFAPLLWIRERFLCGGLLTLGLCLGVVSSFQKMGLTELWEAGSLRWGLFLQIALFMAAGLHLLVLAAVELRRRRDAVAVALTFWILGVILFSTVLNWAVNARSLLPIVPAAAILLMRRLERDDSPRVGWGRLLWPLAPSLALGWCVAAADFKLANSARRAARVIAPEYHSTAGRLWFAGHWGFQYYMQQLGAQPVDFARTTLQPGDILVVPSNNSNVDWPKPGDVELLRVFKLRVFSWLNTMRIGSGAGFYAEDYGPLPFVVGPALPESYTVFEVSRPLQFRSSMAMLRLGGETLRGQVSPPAGQAELEAALEANPGDAKAHAQLALLLERQAKLAEAIAHFREALRLAPDDPAVLNNLAWVLTAARAPELRDGNEAVRLARRAVELTGRREPMLIGTLAAAYAETGQFSNAVETAQAACDLAAAAGQKEVATMNRKLLELYRAGKTIQSMTNSP
jgi:4-amino-4-deoxy-L-arabinose transferase-like glycosyltransferase